MEENSVIKSRYDHREYRIIKLRNGLEALLVHDSHINTKEGSSKPAAASMTVNVGYLDSPKNVQGLAHLLEHMLLQKSKHFSENEGYNQYISEHGGETNAFTDSEYSCYNFQVDGKFLKGALERFADGLIHPIFTKHSLKAEVKAIDNEFLERRNRHKRLVNCFRCHSSKESHPFHNIFGAGNRKSLMGQTMRYEVLYKKVCNFYLGKFKGNLMKLVLIGGESLHVLQRWVKRFFKSLKKCVKSVKKSNQTWAQRHHIQSKTKNRRLSEKTSIWKSGVMHHIAESNNENVLKVMWTLPCLRSQYLYHPERYVSYLFNHHDKGSLCSFLQKRGWALFVNSGIEGGICMTSAGYVFVITVVLTDSGLLKVNKIIGVIYQYLNLLRNSHPQWIFEELKRIGEMKFNIGEAPQNEYAVRLSENLLFYKAKDVIYADYWCKRWDENLINQILDYFIPTNMRVEVFSTSFEKEANQLEPWYGTRYFVHNIGVRSMELWKKTEKVHQSLDFPIKNPFILYEDFVGVGGTGDFSNLTSPKLIVNEEMIKFWYKKNDVSNVPRVAIRIGINFKSTCDNVRNSALSNLFVDLLVDYLIDVIYKARVAMMHTKLSFFDGMVQLEVVGFFNKMIHILLSKILSKINYFMPTNASRFKLLKEDMRRNFMNKEDEPLEILLVKHVYENDEKGFYLGDDLSLKDMKKFIQDIRSQVFIMGLCTGNITEQDANDICKSVTQSFQQAILPIPLRHVEKVICLPPNKNYVVNFSGDKGTTQVQLYFQIGQNLFESPRLIALLELFATIVDHDFFDDLRNKKHLGYTVGCSISLMHSVWGLEFHILTPDHKPSQIQPIIQKYIDDLEEFLRKLDKEVFKNYQTSLAETLSYNGSLEEKTNQFWGEIIKYRCNFNFTQEVVKELKYIEKKHLFKFYKQYFKKSSTNCRRLWVNFDCSREEIEKGDDEDEVNFDGSGEEIEEGDDEDVVNFDGSEEEIEEGDDEGDVNFDGSREEIEEGDDEDVVNFDGFEEEIEEGDDEGDVYVEVHPKKDLNYYEDKLDMTIGKEVSFAAVSDASISMVENQVGHMDID